MRPHTILALHLDAGAVEIGLGIFAVVYGAIFLAGASKHRKTASSQAKKLFWCGLIGCVGGLLLVLRGVL